MIAVTVPRTERTPSHGFMQMSALEGCRAAMRLMWEFLARNV
jgi:hypothetical protein